MDWTDFIINAGMSAMLLSLKNKKKVAAMRRAMLKLYRAIQAAYPDDPDFGTSFDLSAVKTKAGVAKKAK